jgi:hypothetical protein
MIQLSDKMIFALIVAVVVILLLCIGKQLKNVEFPAPEKVGIKSR